MAYDIQKLMQQPGMIAALNLLANSTKTPGTTRGSRVGAAGIDTLKQLQAIESESARRTWQKRQSDIQEERNRIAAEYDKERLKLQERTTREAEKTGKAQRARYEEEATWVPENKQTGEPGHWVNPDGTVKTKPTMNPLDLLLSQLYGGPGMLTGAGGPSAPPVADPYSTTIDQLNKAPAAPAGPQPGATIRPPIPAAQAAPAMPAPQPGMNRAQIRPPQGPIALPGQAVPGTAVVPGGQVQPAAGPFQTMGRNALNAVNPLSRNTGPLTPAQQLQLERMRLLGGYY